MIDFRVGLNDRQQQAVLATEGPVIVLAGAGSGKTKMITHRIAYLIQEKKVPAHQILAVTFTNKAAAEMKSRVQSLLEPDFYPNLAISTFHSLCVRILRNEHASTGFTQPFTIYDDGDQLTLIKTVLQQCQISETQMDPYAVRARINRVKCDAPDSVSFTPPFQDVFEAYQKELHANNALDFGEILCMTYRLLKNSPALLKKYQKLYQYIHVDEYQDTNSVQYHLLALLASHRHGGNENICVVGDEDQSIYQWRGADSQNVFNFAQEYPSHQIIKLEQNYRSTQTILAASEGMIAKNQLRHSKTLWTENPVGPPIVLQQLANERLEAEWILAEITRLTEKNGSSYSDCALFYRTNAQSRVFEDAFNRARIPYELIGGLRFYDRKEIKDILAYFKFILNPADTISFKRLIQSPSRGIGKTSLEKIFFYHSATASSQKTLTEKFLEWNANPALIEKSLKPNVLKKLETFATMIQRLQDRQSSLYLAELYRLLLDETEFVRRLKEEGSDEALERIENLKELDRVLSDFDEFETEGLGIAELDEKKKQLLSLFIEQSSLDSTQATNRDATIESVKLMTLHASKGLEFPIVFLVGMEEGLLPSLKEERASDESIEEERRLCYVGITRTREQLYLSHVAQRQIWGKTSYPRPSRFIREIPPSTLISPMLPPSSTSSFLRPGRSVSHSSNRRSGHPSSWIGKNINHPDYGFGSIIASEGEGEDQKVVIHFQALAAQKKFFLRYLLNYIGQTD